MALVNIINIGVLNNPSSFHTDFQFEIQFECLQSLPEDLDWKLTYVGDPESNQRDQILDEISVGPVVAGMHKFILTTPPPNSALIRNEDLIGVTAILITCNYLDQEFVRIGYFVNNDYSEPFEPENYPNPVDINLLFRSILANEPRVTRYAIDWTGQAPVGAPLEAVQDGEVPIANPDDEEEEMGDEEDDVETDEDEEEEEEDGDADIDLEADASMDGDIEEDGDDDGEGQDGDDEEEDVEGGGGHIQYIDEDSMDVQQMQVDIIGNNSHSFPTPFL